MYFILVINQFLHPGMLVFCFSDYVQFPAECGVYIDYLDWVVSPNAFNIILGELVINEAKRHYFRRTGQ